MLGKGVNLGLEEDHVLGESLHGVSLLLTLGHALDALLLSSLVLAVVSGVDNSHEDENDKDGSKSSQTLRVLSEEVGDSQQDQRNEEEADKDVHNGETLPDTGGASKSAGSSKRPLSHPWDRVPDEDTEDVEEQVSQSNLEGICALGDKGSHDGGHGSTNVGSKSQRKHLFQSQGTNSDKRSKSGSGDGRGLDEHGETDTEKDGEVSVDVGGLVDDASGGSQKHLLENVNKSKEAEEEDSDGDGKDNKSGDLIFVTISSGLEEGGTLIIVLVTSDQTNLASFVGWVVVVGASNLVVEVRARASCSNGRDDLLVGNDNLLSKGGNNLLDGSLPLLSLVGLEVLDTGFGEVVKHTRGTLKGEQDGDSHEVEHIVNSGSGKGTLELVSISQVTHGNDSVGNRGTNVGSHDHVDTLASTDSIGSDERNNDRGGGRRRLKKDSGEDSDHKTGNRVGFISEEFSSGTSSHNLGTRSKKFQSKEEEVEEEANPDESNEDQSPLLRRVDAAGLANFLPGSISDLVNILLTLVVDVSYVHGSGRAILAVLG